MKAYLIATACTKFEKKADQTFKSLTEEVYCDLLKSAKVENGDMIGQAWFGNCGMGTFGQNNIRGQVCFTPLVQKKLFPERVGIINVEGGCATGSMAFHGAWKDVISGTEDVSLAIGVEKIYQPNQPEKIQEIYDGGIDQFDRNEWLDFYKSIDPDINVVFNKTYDLLSNASIAVVTSGTATLETALFKVPQIVCYKSSLFSYLIGKLFIKVKFISLVNIIMEREVVKELIQKDCSKSKIINELSKLLKNENILNLKKEYKILRERLGKEETSLKVAKMITKV